MTRNLKALGLALLAVFATSAVVAQAASAENHEFTATGTSAVLTGSGTEHEFTASESAAVKCDASFAGRQEEETADHIKIFPKYTNCEVEIFGGIGATVTNSGCTYTFESDTVVVKAPVALTCNHEDSITIVDAFNFCIIHFADTHTVNEVEKTVNQVLGGVEYENVINETEEYVTVNAEVSGITYEATQSGCELLGIETGTHHDGFYKGSATVRAYEDTDDEETVHVYEHGEEIGGYVELDTEG